ncbi:MAG: peptidylprolyl isomerase [Bacilli bacterium]|nr:peptidylprolyl isomerase [Bacilli bacterium]
MKRKLFLLSLSLFLLTGCGEVPKLKNGEDAVVSFKDGGISTNELYEEIKKNYGLESLVTLIDKYVLEKEFDNYIEEAKEQATSTIDAMKESYGGEEELLEAIQTYTSYPSIEAYKEVVYLSYLQEKAVNEYAKTLVTDKEIEKYYKNNVYGDVSVNHILITADIKSDATDDEKKKAEDDAKAKVEDIIKILKEAKSNKKDVLETFKKLAKDKSEDDDSKEKGGELGYINYNTLGSAYDELVKAALELENGDFSTKVITTELGYHVIYRVDQKEKAKLEDVKEDLIDTLAQEKISSDAAVSVDALQHYRKLYDMEINDSELKTQYTNYIQNLIASTMPTEESDSE